jgi:hypothetical protein
MKKLFLCALGVIATLGITFVSCEDPNSSEHVYTPEELAEIARQDSLKQLIPADYIFTQDITIPISKGYAGVTVSLDSTKLCELFEYASVAELVAGLGTLDAEGNAQLDNEITFFALNYSTKYEVTDPSTSNYFGHWFDANGDVCSWGETAYLFCEKQDETSLNFTIGLYPDRGPVDSVYHIIEAMKYDDYTVAFLFNVKIGPVEQITATVVGTSTLETEAELDATYTATALDIPVATITSAIGCAPEEATLLGVNADNSLFVAAYTANNGYWFSATGDVCSWGTEGAAIFAEYDATNQKINVGQKPEGCTVGQTYSATLAFINNGSQYNVVVSMTVTEPTVDPYPQATVMDSINLAFAVDTINDYTATVLELDTVKIATALGCEPAAASLYGVSADDSLYIAGFTANNGCWFNASGDVCNYGNEGCALFAEYNVATQSINVGQYPHGCTSGQTYRCKLAFINDGKQVNVIIAMTIN